MSTIVRRNVDELPQSSRQSIEQLIGTPLEANQRVYIIVESPLIRSSDVRRLHSAQRVDGIGAHRISHE